MGVNERDPYTGHATTGHEWNGIKELNTAVPWPVWAFLTTALLFSVGYWILMPAWPLGSSYTKGLLGNDVKEIVDRDLRNAVNQRSTWSDHIDQLSFETIQNNPDLMHDVRETGHALFGDNCGACHGENAYGGPGFPDLRDTRWLWGGTPADVQESIRVGINSNNPESRFSQMPAWGRNKMLDQEQISDVARFVKSLSDSAIRMSDPDSVEAGRNVFKQNCSACHGTDAKGNTNIGAPDLTDNFWLYGSDLGQIYTSIYYGRQGHMPAWEDRLSSTDRKLLVLYLLDLGQPTR